MALKNRPYSRKDYIFFIIYECPLIFLIIFTPIFYGSVLPFTLALMQYISLFLFLSWLFQVGLSGKSFFIYPSCIWAMAIFFVIVILQCTPLPHNLQKILSEKTIQLYHQYSPGWADIKFSTLSIYPLATKVEMAKLFSYFCIFFVTLNIVNRKAQLERLLTILIVWAFCLALYGVMNSVVSNPAIRTFSTFGNRNHYASYMVMIAPLSIGYAFACSNKYKKILFAFMATVIAASVFLSLSRAGAVSLIFALFLFAICFLVTQRFAKMRNIAVIGIIISVIIILLGLANLEPLRQRLLEVGRDIVDRLALYRDSLMMVRDFYLWGIGLGCFRYLFAAYQTFPSAAFYTYPHNDHIQLLVEAGIPAALCYFLFLTMLAINITQQLRQRYDFFVKSLVLGGMCGLAGAFFHGFFDFSFHIPAVSFLFWFLLGLVYKCVYTHFYEEETASLSDEKV